MRRFDVGIERRGVLRSGFVLGLLQALTACASNAPPTEERGANGSEAAAIAAIDVHCHVFNSRDLPISGFLQHIYVPEAIEHAPVLGETSNALTLLLAHMMQGPAPTAAAEYADVGRARTLSAPQADARSDDEVLRDSLLRALPGYLFGGSSGSVELSLFSVPGSRFDAPPATAPAPQEKELLLQVLTGDRSIVSTDRRSFQRDVRRLTEQILSGPEAVVGVLRLAALLGLPRAELMRRLAALPAGNQGAEVRLFTPAVIDFTMWLTDGPLDMHGISPLPDQVDVMSEIAAKSDRAYGVHPFVPFCPWRQVRDADLSPSVRPRGMTPLDIVKYAITRKGFVGVKVYPVLGFLPYGNAAQWSEHYPPQLRAIDPDGTKLDRALADLYDWCIEEDVPILTHTSLSQNPTPEAGQRGSPEHWQTVLDFDGGRWKNLRLNLGHLGGLWHLTAEPTPSTWPGLAIGLLLDRYPNVYADVADYDAIMHRTETDAEKDRRIAELLVALLARPGNPLARNRLMYGTDWVMLSKSLGTRDYYQAMRDTFTRNLALSPSQRREFMGTNAARYLGLSLDRGRKPKTRQRLERFYAERGLGVARLTLWDAARTAA
ncbi:amidohydrolase family protein [Falsiroseomonas sp. HW251]|uniref:amidohydrolase family protein n=1 Tax=Falsiroseomonas sp. HW251 TaxID=3390998 RepID=UPI003D31E642